MPASAKTKAAKRGSKAAQAQEPSLQTTIGEESALIEDSGLYHELGFVLRVAQINVFEDILSRLAPLKLTLTQFTILRLVKAKPGLMQQHIGDALGVKKTNLVALIDKLEEMGLLTRMSSTVDRRAYALHLTAKGERMHETAMKAADAHTKLLTKVLGADEFERAIAAMRTLAAALAAERRKRRGDA